MKWFILSFSPKQSLIFATVFLLIALGAAYFFWFVPNNQNILEQKQFRCLQTMQSNVTDKIDNSLNLLNSLIDDYLNPPKYFTAKQIQDYIDSYPKDNFRLRIKPAEKVGPVPTIKKETKAIDTKVAKAGSLPAVMNSDTTFTLTDQSFSIRLKRKGVMIEIIYTNSQFIGPMLRQELTRPSLSN